MTSLEPDAQTEIDEILQLARPLENPAGFDPLLDALGHVRVVLLGEASHGTADFYRWRAELTRRLIAEEGFDFVAVEGDWPDCYSVNQWVKGRQDGQDPSDALQAFQRWPTWMWANHEVADFIEWVRRHNETTGRGVGFYGLDVYSLWESLRQIISYLERSRPDALNTAIEAFRCFQPYDEDPQRYAMATRMIPTDCEDEVIELLTELHHGRVPNGDPEAEFDARQNSRALAGAERYYRTMVLGNAQSWNVRDLHMADTLDALLEHHGSGARGVIWAHNTHVGDARGSDMADAGLLNLGQVTRERRSTDEVALVGFGGYAGRVVAATAWGNAGEVMRVPDAREGSHEQLLHAAGLERSLLVFPDLRDTAWLASNRVHRAIGVVYRPEGDRRSNWVPTVMGQRYDAFCYFESTTPLRPLIGVSERKNPQVHAT